MFFMFNEKDDCCKICMVEFVDGKIWDVVFGYIVYFGEEEGKNVFGFDLWKWKGKCYIIYYVLSGNCYVRIIDKML